jgi:hypothetical protein
MEKLESKFQANPGRKDVVGFGGGFGLNNLAPPFKNLPARDHRK